MNRVQQATLSALLLILTNNVIGESSAESILEGLKKAESETITSEAANDNSVDQIKTDNRLMYRSFSCTKSGLERKIAVDYPEPETGYVCRVLYDSEKGSSVPWNARNDKGYCESKAAGFVKKHLKMGWDCVED